MSWYNFPYVNDLIQRTLTLNVKDNYKDVEFRSAGKHFRSIQENNSVLSYNIKSSSTLDMIYRENSIYQTHCYWWCSYGISFWWQCISDQRKSKIDCLCNLSLGCLLLMWCFGSLIRLWLLCMSSIISNNRGLKTVNIGNYPWNVSVVL